MDDIDWYSDERATFGDRLTFAREAAGLSQDDLARRLGGEVERLARWEADTDEPRANRLQLIAGMLGVSLAWLLTGEGDAPTEDGPVEAGPILAEMRQVRGEMARAAERLGRLEKRLRAALAA